MFFNLKTIVCALFAMGFVCNAMALEGNNLEKDMVLIDVRSIEEYNEGYLEGAINIPQGDIETKIKDMVPSKDATLYVYCKSGRRASIAEEKLKNMGYTTIYNLGGIKDAEEKLNLPIIR